MVKHRDYQFWVPITIICAVVVALIIGVIVAAQPFDDPDGCNAKGELHTVVETDNSFSPDSVEAKKCDILKFVNHSTIPHTIMFGNHADMIVYDGVMEKILQPEDSFSVTLRTVGSFRFHDNDASLMGTFTVK